MAITREQIKNIRLTQDAVCVERIDGKIGKEYFDDYPRLKYATPLQRDNYSTSNIGIHWAELDEDLSFEGFFSENKPVSKIGKIFSQFHELNISAFARRMGIPQSVMAAYLTGLKIPSADRKKKMEKTLHEMGHELLSVKL